MKFSVVCLLFLPLLTPCFGAGRQLTGPYTPAVSPPLSPAEAQKKFVVPDGFEVRLFAAEPDVVNPVAMTWDERGRLWVVELYEYPLGAPPGTRPRDCIKILEDTDNDGRADKVTIFTNGLNLATGILIGHGGAYVGQAPDLLFFPFAAGTDAPRSMPFPKLTGFGLEDRHELLNGFTWGPDGWLYLTQGIFTRSKVKNVLSASVDSHGGRELRLLEPNVPGVEMNAAVARFDPLSKRFEVFADGTSNPWGVDFDRYGNAFVSACVIDHLFHMIPGGLYVRQSRSPANPYAYELLPSIVDHKHHMAAYCGVCIYQGDQFPEEYRGHVFMGNIHQNAVNHDRLIPNGSSFKAVAEKDFVTTRDGWFRPVSEQVGPDGALWIADWYDKYPCYQNAQADPDGVDRAHGRIWRVVYTGKNPGTKITARPDKNLNLAELPSESLVKLLEHPNVWQRRMAQRLLSERGDGRPMMPDKNGKTIFSGKPAIVDLLKHVLANGKGLEARLAALWTLHGAGTLRDEVLEQYASDRESAVRAWVARFSGEQPSETRLVRLQRMAADPDPSVKLAVAVAARQFVSSSLTVDTGSSAVEIGPLLTALIKSSADAKDPCIPFMIWMAGEPSFARNPEGGLKWLAENGPATMPLSGILTRKAMRRICDLQEPAKLDLAAEFLQKVIEGQPPSLPPRPDTRHFPPFSLALAAIDGLIEGQRAKPLVPATDTKRLFAKLNATSNPQLKERAQQLGALWGDAASLQASLAAINDSNLSVEQRSKAIQSAKSLKNEKARDALLRLINTKKSEPLVIEAIRALGDIGGDAVADDLLKSWQDLTPSTRANAAEVLVSRRPWTIALLSAIETKRIPATDLPMSAVRTLGRSKDEFIHKRAVQAIGRINPAKDDKEEIIEAKKQMILKGGPPDLQAGHELAKKTCLICHKLNGEGAEVGPDLTGVGRSTLDALLANVIDPNQIIGPGYENVEVETKDGRSISGRLAENTDTRIKLLSSGPKEEVIAKSDIASMRVSELSVMPEGLEQMPDADFKNLILYILNAPQEQTFKRQ